MFEKRQKKEERVIDSDLEEITKFSERKYAVKIYIPEFDSIYKINPLGVLSLENDDLFCVMEDNELKNKFDLKKIKLYKNKKS